jgi:hypothetical protein
MTACGQLPSFARHPQDLAIVFLKRPNSKKGTPAWKIVCRESLLPSSMPMWRVMVG